MAGDQEKFKVAMLHAQKFRAQGDLTKAIRAYRFALAEFPNNIEAVMGFGESCLEAGQTDVAEKAFQQAIRLDPASHHALTHIGDIQAERGEAASAAQNYVRVGNILSSQSDMDGALSFWEQAVELAPGLLEGHRNLAQGRARQGETRRAAYHYLRLAAIYQARHESDEVEQQIQAAQDLLGDEPAIIAAYDAFENGEIINPDLALQEPEPDVPDIVPPAAEDAPPIDNMFGSDDLDDLFNFEDEFDEPPPQQQQQTAPAQASMEEEDPFAFDLSPDRKPMGGLTESVQQEALGELANVIFDEDESLAAATMPRDQINLLIIQAIDLQRQDNIQTAVENYRKVVQAGVRKPALYYNLGLLYQAQGQYDDSIKMLKASSIDSHYQLAAYFAMGEAYYAVNKVKESAKQMLELLRTIDLDTVRSDREGDLYDQYDRLLNSYEAQTDPAAIRPFITALRNFFGHHDWENRVYEARQRLNTITTEGTTMSLAEFLESPESEVVITGLALTGEYIKRDLFMTASEECLRSIQRAPGYLRLHERLGDILMRQNNTDGAINKYLTVARVYQMRGQEEMAVDLYQKILHLAPMDVTVRSRLIDLYVANGEREKAVEQYYQLADSYYQLAQVDRSLEKYNEALRLVSNTKEGNEWKVKILNQMTDIYMQRFDWARASDALKQLMTINPNDERAQRQLIDLYFKQMRAEQALSTLDKLLAFYTQRKQPNRALDLVKDLAMSYPENMQLRQRLAAAYHQNGMKAEAIEEYDGLGEMQLENGLRDQAIQTIQAIIAIGPDDPSGYHQLLAQIKGGAL